jgi:type I restriction enzyme S subunit
MTWTRTRIDRVATVNARIGWKALTASEYQPDGYVFLATPNIKTESIDFDNVNYISEYRYHESPELKLQPGDVLLAKDGSTLGITNIVRELPRPATVNGSIAVLRAFDIEHRFLRYSLASRATQDLIGSIKGGMGVPHLFQWDIKRLPLVLPPFDEQRRIADFLDTETAKIDRLAADQLRMIQVLDERRIAVTSHLIYGRDRSGDKQDSTIPTIGPIPLGWQISRNKTFLRETMELSATGCEELLTVSHLTGVTPRSEKDVNMFLAESMVGYKRCRPGDLVINTLWAWMGALGVSQYEGIVSPAYGTYRMTSDSIDSRYLDAILRTPEYVTEMIRFSKGVWTSRLRLYPESFLALSIPVPPLGEQEQIMNRIASETFEQQRLKTKLESFAKTLAERRQALITAAVTGQIDVSTAGRGATG